MAGMTQMGLDTAKRAVTDVSFRSAYLLVSKPQGDGSITGRIDAFAIEDHSFLDLEDNAEKGAALTGAWAKGLSGATELVTEIIGVWSDRATRTRTGVRAEQVEVQTKIAIRTRF